MSADEAVVRNMPVLAKVVGYSFSAVPPEVMGLGPISATLGLLEAHGLTMRAVGHIELNEAFAAVAGAEDEVDIAGIYRDWIRIYVPVGSKLIKSQGLEQPLTESQDLGKTILPSINLDIVQKTMHKASPATKSNPFEVSTGILAKGRKKSGNNTTTKNNDKKESRSNILVFIK